MQNKLIVFCLDALCTSDIELMKKYPSFNTILSEGSLVKHIEPVYPSLTYPCHCSIITGVTVDKHQVLHNEKVEVENKSAPWYNQRSDMKVDTIFDIAKKHGINAGAISWPVMGKADIDYNMPMIVPISYSGDNPKQFYEDNASQVMLNDYFDKYAHRLVGKDRSLDLFTMDVALNMLRDNVQPDMFFIKMCDLDTVKHIHGVYADEVDTQLKQHDDELTQIINLLKNNGTYENTNIVILGDHGQSDIKRNLNMNVLLKENCFIRVDDNGELIDYDAYCHSASLSAWITLKNPADDSMRQKVYDFLLKCKNDESLNIGHLFTKLEAKQLFGLEADIIDFVIEGKETMSFGTTLEGHDLFKKYLPKEYHNSKASHGHMPSKDETTTLFGSGPNIKKGSIIERRSMVDIAPTLSAIMNFSMDNVDGKVIDEFINKG